MVLVQKGNERLHGAGAKHKVSVLWAVAGDVAECPDRLFPNVKDLGREELDEDRYGAFVDDDLGVV